MGVTVSTIKYQFSAEHAFFHAYEGPIFSGFRSDAVALIYV